MKINRVHPFKAIKNILDLDVTEGELKAWENGLSAQLAFPRLNADEREFIISGIPPGEWDDYVPET